MNFLRKIIRYGLGGLVGGLFATGVGLILFIFPVGRSLINLSFDLPFASFLVKPHPPQGDVAILYMDEESHDHLKQPFIGGWDRNIHARLLERLLADGARAAVFDVVFSNESNPQADAHLAKAVKDFKYAILAADEARVGYGMNEVKGSQIQGPLESIGEGMANIGLSNVDPDEDLVVRRHIRIKIDDQAFPMSFALAQVLEAPITKHTNEWGDQRFVNFYGPPAYLPNYSYYRALDTNDLKPGFFKNKVVFVGSRIFTKTAGERKDEYRSPYSRWAQSGEQFVPGVEIQATQFLNLVENSWLNRLPFSQEFNIILLLGLLFGFGLTQVRPFFATLLAVAMIAATGLLAYVLVSKTQIWFGWMIVVVQICVAYGWSVIFNSVNMHVQGKLLAQSVSMYVSPSRVKQIVKGGDFVKPGATKRELSILFSDIANFTSMSEGMDSDELATMMNKYFENAVNNCINRADGTVVKYIGDAIFAIWNAPELQESHQALACKGALLLRDSITDFEFKTPRPDLDVRTRIGLHCGVANVGNFGSSTRVDYTALGENINLASRMEGLNKYVGTDILVTGDVMRPVQGQFIARFVGQFILKGFGKWVEVHELVSLPDKAAESQGWRDAFAAALEPYKARKWDEARAAFNKVLEMKPKDGPSKFYLEYIKYLEEHPPGPNWTGEVEMKEK